ncbi:MAG: helix-turn-helix domain-containing protein [Candidatus Aenigmarchaeota archaeon]|nr:helix-turn-helix domain-containing protein [Candidatus Aenigmarchaeota archaeon]
MLNLRQEVQGFLEKSDYVTCEYKGCFDIAAKKDALLLLKVLLNIDGFQREQARNLKIISNNLDAHPFLIGVQTNREKLKTGIVYERYETPTVSLKTFEDLIVNSIFPRIYRDRGGLYVEIDSAILREIRKKKGLTQRELAEAIGINKKVIYEHEKKQLRMLLEIAEKIERTLNQKIIKPIEVFKKYEEHGYPKDSIERGVKKHLEKIGFKTDFVKQAPLDVFAKEKSLVLSDIEINKRKMKQHAASLKDFINVVKKPAILITEKTRDEEILGIPVIERKKLKEIDKKELIKKAKKAI